MTTGGRVLVTGATGFVGRRVVAALEQRGSEVVSVGHRWDTADELADRVGTAPIGSAIHLGWYADPRDYLTNASGNLASLVASTQLVDLLQRLGCGHLVVAGTCAEYVSQDRPLDEGDPIGPWSVYGASKAALHQLLTSSWVGPDMGVSWARLFNLTGPGEHPDRLIPFVVRSLLAGQTVALSPGEQQRDFLDVDDVAGALVHLADVQLAGAVNVCSGVGVTLRSLLEGLADRVGGRDLLDFGARPYGDHDPMMTVGRNERLRATGWVQERTTSQLLDRVAGLWSAGDDARR